VAGGGGEAGGRDLRRDQESEQWGREEEIGVGSCATRVIIKEIFSS
jgi:hypothetical protein